MQLFFFPLRLNSFANSLHNIGAAWAVPESPRAEHVLMFESPPCPAQTPLCSHHSPGSVGGGDTELGRELSVPGFILRLPRLLPESCQVSSPVLLHFQMCLPLLISLATPLFPFAVPTLSVNTLFLLKAQSLAWRVVPPACLIKRKTLKSPPCSSLQSCCACQ